MKTKIDKLTPVETYLLEHEKKLLDGSTMKMLSLENDNIIKQFLLIAHKDKNMARA